MTKREIIHKEFDALYQEGVKLAVAFQKKEEKQFQYDYQRWYTKALKAVASLAADRHAEFRSYYEIDPKRKSLGYGTYVIQEEVYWVRSFNLTLLPLCGHNWFLGRCKEACTGIFQLKTGSRPDKCP